NLDVALGQLHKTQQSRGLDDWQQIVNLEREEVGQPVDVLAAIVVGENFEESGDAAGACVRKHRVFRANIGGRWARQSKVGIAFRLGQHLVDVVDDLGEARVLAIARARKVDMEVRSNSARVLTQNHDAIAQQDRFLD